MALAVLWSVVTLYFLFTLFPPGLHIFQRQEARLKNVSPKMLRPPTWWQRFVFVLLAGFMTLQLYANALHQDPGKITGLSSSAALLLMLILPALYFLLGIFQRRPAQKDRS